MHLGIVGANGMLGMSLRNGSRSWGFTVTDFTRGSIRESESLEGIAQKFSNLDAIVNAAAFTDVEKAEIYRDQCLADNANLPLLLSRVSEIVGIPIVHVSTDFVFSGRSSIPYRVSDSPDPINFYGYSKRAGELAILERPNGHVVRTSWLVRDFETGFLGKLSKLAQGTDQIRIVSDQFGVPTHVEDLTTYILNLVSKPMEAPIYHGVSVGYASRYEFGVRALREILGYRGSVVPIQTEDLASNVLRPKFAVLDPSPLESYSIGAWESVFERLKLDK